MCKRLAVDFEDELITSCLVRILIVEKIRELVIIAIVRHDLLLNVSKFMVEVELLAIYHFYQLERILVQLLEILRLVAVE